MTRPANPRYGKSRPVDSTAAGRGAYLPVFNSQTLGDALPEGATFGKFAAVGGTIP